MTTRNSMTRMITMITMTRAKWTLSGLALASLMACSGSKDNPPPPPPPKTIADRLDYTNPTSGTYTLVKDNASTSTHLVLNLMGPVGTQGTGVGFYLSADTSKVTWAKVNSSDAEFVKNGAFTLGSGVQLLKSKVIGDQLQGAVYQKGTTAPAVTFTASTVLASVALDMKGNVPVGSIVWSSTQAPSTKAVLNQGSGASVPITINYGTLTAN